MGQLTDGEKDGIRWFQEQQYKRRQPRRSNWGWLLIAGILLIVVMILTARCTPLPVEAKMPVPTNIADPMHSPTPVVTLTSTTVQAQATATREVCVVSTGMEHGTVNVRSGPGMNYPVVDVAKEGEALIVWGSIENGWRAVSTPQLVIGWFLVERWCK